MRQKNELVNWKMGWRKEEKRENLAQNNTSQECRLREITDSMKRSSVRIITIHEAEKKERGLEEIFEQL